MPNRKLDCWFNSLSQALVKSDLASRILELQFSELDISKQRFLKIWYFMRLNSPSQVPIEMVEHFLTSPSNAFVQSLPYYFGNGRQQDPHDFYASFISDLARQAQYFSEGYTERICMVCGDTQRTSVQELFIELSLTDGDPSIQTLVDNYFAKQLGPDNFDCTKCKNKTQVSLSNHATSLSKTIMIAIKRSVGVKDTRSLDIKHFITFDNRHISSGLHVYSLKSIVSHYGHSINFGHYTSHIFDRFDGNVFMTTCDDMNITVRELKEGILPDFIKKEAYILIYESHNYSQNDLVFGVPIMHLISLYAQIKNAFKNCKYSLDNIFNTSDIRREELVINLSKSKNCYDFRKRSEEAKDALLNANMKVMDGPKFLESVLIYLSGIGSSSYIFKSNVIEFVIIHCFFCSKCSKNGIIRSNHVAMEIKNLCIDNIENNICKIKPTNRDVKCCPNPCIEEKCSFVDSVPNSITLFIKENITQVITGLQQRFDMNSVISKAYPCTSDIFVVKHLLLFLESGTEFSLLTRPNNENHEFVEILSDDQIKQIDMKYIESKLGECSSLVVVLERQKYSLVGSFVSLNSQLISCTAVPMKPFSDYIQNHESLIGKYRITEGLIVKVLDIKSWFCDKVLDAYFHLMSMNTQNNIIFAPAGWFNQLFFNDKICPRPYAYSRFIKSSLKLLSFDRIFFPINVQGHWILIVVDLTKQLIIMCDSFAQMHESMIFALTNFIAQTSLIENHIQLSLAHFKIEFFHTRPGFQKQSDNASCGPYICTMAKCIEYEMKFEFDATLARNVIAHELITKKIIL